MNEHYSDSFVVKFERRDGKPDDEEYFDNKYDAMDLFNSVNVPNDKEITEKYRSISVDRVDWNYKSEYNLDGVVFDD